MNDLIKSKVWKYIKKLKRQEQKYARLEAMDLILRQLQIELGCKEEDMEEIRDYLVSVFDESWPFKSLI